MEDEDPLLAWIPRHTENWVSRYKLLDDACTPERRCGKIWRRPVVEFGALRASWQEERDARR